MSSPKPRPGSQPRPLRFGEIGIKEGLLRPSQVEECLSIQTMQRRIKSGAALVHREIQGDRLGDILVHRGYLDEAGVQRILRVQAQQRAQAAAAPAPVPAAAVEDSSAGFGARTEAAAVAEEAHRTPSTPGPTRPVVVAEPERSVDNLPPGVAEKGRMGDFEILGRIGQGSMGAIYLARQISLDRKVALKVLPLDLAHDQEFLERFRREARMAGRLNHPNIASAYDVGVVSGYHYIAMEYVNGPDLERDMKRCPGGRYAPEEVLRVARDMANALAAAVAYGVVHRDIKPANILRDQDGTYKLTDLGLASPRVGEVHLALDQAKQKRVTGVGVAVGTPYYISPEQARGEQAVDVRSDIYSLGATLYHLATGQVPFPGDNAVVVMTSHLTEDATPPMEVDPNMPMGLSRLIEKMMAKRLEDRHQTVEELLEDIDLVEQGGVPLLKRARFRPGGVVLARAGRELRERAEDGGSNLPPRASRIPAARRTASSPLHPGGLSPRMRKLVLWGAILAGAALVGLLAALLRRH